MSHNFVFASVGLLLATLVSLINAQAPQTSFFPAVQPGGNNLMTDLNIVGDGATRYFDVIAIAPVQVAGLGFIFADVGDASRTLLTSVYTRAAGGRGFEQNATLWTLRFSGSLLFSDAAAPNPVPAVTTSLGVTLQGMLATFTGGGFVIPVGTTGIAVTLTDPAGGQLADTYMDGTNSTVSYQFAPPGNGFNVTMRASTMTDAPFSGTVLGYHEPWIALTVDAPNALLLDATTAGNCSAPVAGQTTITFVTTVTNTGNEHLSPVLVDELLTPSQAVSPLSTVTHTISPVTGCRWTLSRYAAVAAPNDNLAGATQIASNQAPIASLTLPILRTGNFSDSGQVVDAIAGQAATMNWFSALTGVAGSVYQARGSVYVASPSVLGFIVPIGYGSGNTAVFIDDVLSSGLGPIDVEGIHEFGMPTMPGTNERFFRQIGGANNEIPIGRHNIRILFFQPITAPSPRDVALEVYLRSTAYDVTPAVANNANNTFGSAWELARSSNDPALGAFFTGSFPNTLTGVTSNGQFNIPSLCTGGSVTLTTTIVVGADVEVGTLINRTLSINEMLASASSAIVTTNPTQAFSCPVANSYGLALSKSTVCDMSIPSYWQAQFWQSNASIVTNGTTPFWDFDNVISALPPTATADHFATINFGNGTSGRVSGDTPFETLFGLSAAPGLFFVRVSGRIEISVDGLYSFGVFSDRGARLTVDGRFGIINNGAPETTNVAADRYYALNLTRGVHDVVLVMYDTNPGSALELFISAGAENYTSNAGSEINSNSTLTYSLLRTAPACMHQCSDDLRSGFSVSQWATTLSLLESGPSPFVDFDASIVNTTPNATICNQRLINFEASTSNATLSGGDVADVFGFDSAYPLGGLTGIDNYFFRATGRFYIAQAGVYTLALMTNRGSRLIIDGVVHLLLEPTSDGSRIEVVALQLAQGLHNVTVDHYDTLGDSFLELAIAAGGVTVDAAFTNMFVAPFRLLESALECQIGTTQETVTAGQPFTYTVLLTNNGPSYATQINVTDALTLTADASVVAVRTEYANDAAPTSLTGGAPNNVWIVRNMPNGSTRRLYIDVLVSPNATTAPSNTFCNAVSAVAVPVGESAGATLASPACVNVTRLFDLQFAITRSAPVVVAGGATQSFNVAVTNLGPSTASPFSLIYATSLSLVDAGVAITASPALSPTLYVGASFTFTVVVAANATALANNLVSLNVAGANITAAGERVIRTCDDAVASSMLVERQADLAVTKAVVPASPTCIVAGDAPANNVAAYTITVTNNGPSTLSAGVALTDTLGIDRASTLGLELTGLRVDETAITGNATFVSNICGPTAATVWNVEFYKPNNLALAALNGQPSSAFEFLDALRANGTAPVATGTYPRLSFASGFLQNFLLGGLPIATLIPAAAGTANFALHATALIDVRSTGYFTFVVRSNRGARFAIDGDVKFVMQPVGGFMLPTFASSNYTVLLTPGVHTLTVDMFDPAFEYMLEVLWAHGRTFDNVPIQTPQFAYVEPAICWFGCDAVPRETRWRIAQWSQTNALADAGVSPFERLDAILADPTQSASPLTTQIAPTIELGPLATPLLTPTNYFLRARGLVFISVAATYELRSLHFLAGSATRLTIDGKIIIADGVSTTTATPLGEQQYRINLPVGVHDVEFDAYCFNADASQCALTLEMRQLPSTTFTALRTANYCQVPTWTLNTPLAVGASATIQFTVEALASANIGVLRNRLHFAQTFVPGERIVNEYTPSDSAAVETCVERRSTLVVDVQRVGANTAIVAGANATAGGTPQYVVSVRNNGPSDTAGGNVTVEFALPAPTDESTASDAVYFVGASPAFTELLTNVRYVWTTGVIAALSDVRSTITLQANSSAPCDANVAVTDTFATQVDAAEILTLAPSTDTETTPVTRVAALRIASFAASATSVFATNDVTQGCYTLTATIINDDMLSDVADSHAVFALNLPLGATVTQLQRNGSAIAPVSVGAGNVLTLATGRLEEKELVSSAPNGQQVTFTIRVCTSSETPRGPITSTLSVVTAGCEQLASLAPASVTVQVDTQATLDLTNTAVVASAIAASAPGNAPFDVTAISPVGAFQADANTLVFTSIIDATPTASANVHRVLPGTTDAGWLVETFVSNTPLVSATVLANFAATTASLGRYSAELFDALDGTTSIATLAAINVTNNYVLCAKAPFVVAAPGAVALAVASLNGAAFEALVDGVPTALPATLTLDAGQHYVELRVVQTAGSGAAALPRFTRDLLVLGGTLETKIVSVVLVSPGVQRVTWTLPVLRAGKTATLRVAASALDQGSQANPNVRNVASYISSVPPAFAPAPTADTTLIPIVVLCNRNVLIVDVAAPATALSPSTAQHVVTLFNSGPSRCVNVQVALSVNKTIGSNIVHVTPSQTLTFNEILAGQYLSENVVFSILSTATVGNTFTSQAQLVAPDTGVLVQGTTMVVKEATIVTTATQNGGTLSPEVVLKGTSVAYNIVVRNDGPSTARNVRVSLVVAGCATCTPGPAVPIAVLDAFVTQLITINVAVGANTQVTSFTTTVVIEHINDDFVAKLVPSSIVFLTRVAKFPANLVLTAFEDGASDSSSGRDGSDSGSSSSSDYETRLIFVELANAHSELRTKNIKVTVQVADHIELAEALLTQSSRDDLVVNGGSTGGVATFHWTVGKLEHGQRSRIALKVRGPAHVTLSVGVDQAKACHPTSVSCEIDADLSFVLPLTKHF